MGGYSYQELDSRLKRLEDKLHFVMKCFTITREVGLVDKKKISMNLFDLYRQMTSAGMEVVSAEEVEKVAEGLGGSIGG